MRAVQPGSAQASLRTIEARGATPEYPPSNCDHIFCRDLARRSRGDATDHEMSRLERGSGGNRRGKVPTIYRIDGLVRALSMADSNCWAANGL